MRTLLLTLAALAIGASSASAVGIDVSFVNCTGDPGFTRQANLDCAGGAATTMLVHFQPAEAISDLVALDTIADFWVQAPGVDINTPTGNFWDFENVRPGGLTVDWLRPAGACADYRNVWNAHGSGGDIAALVRSPNNTRIAALVYRPDPVAVAQDERLFGLQLILSTAGAVQAGGSFGGCPDVTQVYLDQGVPQSAAANATTTLVNCGPYFCVGPQATLNDTPVPATRRTWGQLKSLYR